MKTYTSELKAQILKEVSETKNIMLVARNHNVNHKTVWNWVHRSKTKVESLKLKRVVDLERRLADKELENRILKDLLKKTNLVLFNDLRLQEPTSKVKDAR